MEDEISVIDWRITTSCQCNCDFCYASMQVADIDYSEVDMTVQKIINSGCKALCISGGEPLLSPYFFEVVKRISQNEIKIYLSTNGYLYMENRDKIEPYISKLSLPLDGYDAMSNAVGGRKEEGFNAVIKILDYYANHPHNFPIKIGTVLTKKNNDPVHFEKMKKLLQGYSINLWKIYEFIPEARGSANKDFLELSKQDRIGFSQYVESLSDGFKISIRFISKDERDAAYFIILPNADVMIPVQENTLFSERIIGNLLRDDWKILVHEWKKVAHINNYLQNYISRDI